MWQVVFIVGGSIAVEALFFNQPVGVKDLLRCFGLFGGGGWFVASYIGLYILAPVLNEYVANASVKKIAFTLGAFFAFELLWGNTLSVGFIQGGYSAFSFIGIYILAGMLRKMQLKVSGCKILGLLLSATFINVVAYIVAVRLNLVPVRDMLFNYINPLVIISAACLLLLFDKFTPPSHQAVYQRIVASVAPSCFAVYLLHVGTSFALSSYMDGAALIYNHTVGIMTFVAMLGYVLCVFMLAVLADQPRKWLWTKLLLPVFRKRSV